MSKRNAKTLGISLALMLVMCVATALLSFSLADPSTGSGGTGGSDTTTLSTTKSNIDYIIDNSKNGGTDESGRDMTPFYIVEVGSAGSSANSPLAAMVAEDKLGDSDDTDISQFVNLVINGWSTQNETMAPNKISYQYISVGSLTSEASVNDAITAVSKADLVYVSNDPNNQYKVGNDIPEQLKLILSGVATNYYTPFIIDSPTKTQNGGNNGGSSSKTYTMLANKIFSTAGYYRDAFAYKTSTSTDVEAYLDRLDTNSLWLPIYGNKKSANWYVDEDGVKTARILTVQKDGTDNAVTDYFKTAAGAGTGTYDVAKIQAAYPDFDPTGKTLIEIDGSALYTYGYSQSEDRPDNVIFEIMAPEDITDTTDLSVYDLIILEKGISDTAITSDIYNMFSGLVYGMQHIVYDSTMATVSTQGEEISETVVSEAKAYQFVVDKVVDANDHSRFANVLVTGFAEMTIYGAASSPSGVKPIADIINNGSYRGSGGGGDSSNLYTVLEVQPCYPIDISLGKALATKGARSKYADKVRQQSPSYDRTDIFYYIQPNKVLNGVTSDEITFDGGRTSLSDMESTDSATTGISARGDIPAAKQNLITSGDQNTPSNMVDYYAWELSKAKVAHLTGLGYNQVNVIHMSSVEFNTSRDTLLDNYDAIYIGGNNSAIKDVSYFITSGRDGNAAVYNMYFHQGGSYQRTSNSSEYNVLTGNDITYSKFVELQKYVAAGMPLIFTKRLSDAYYGAKTQRFNQTLLDPQSNVYKLMALYMTGDAALTSTNGDLVYPTEKANVLAGFDPTDQVKIPNNGDYGTTYGGYVTVFGGTSTEVYVSDGTTNRLVTLAAPNTQSVNAEELSVLLTSPDVSKRPKFSLLQSPANYVEGDASTEISGNQLKFKFDVAPGMAYSVNIYADDNTNSRFEEKEKLSYTQSGNVITATFSNSFDGALYWKFEIVSGNCASSVTGLSKVTVKTPNKVRVLQIAPACANSGGDNGDTMLLFCTDCMQHKGILKGNRKADGGGKYSNHVRQTANNFNDSHDYSVGGTLPTPGSYDTAYTDPAPNHQLGVHQHNFGVVKYDANLPLNSTMGSDDWTTNWMYDLIKDYDVDIDILTTRDYEAMVNDAVSKVTSANATTVLEDYATLASIYNNYYLTLKNLINKNNKDKVDVTSTTYKYLRNKLTKTNTAFSESDLNSLFGEPKAAYDLETAKGGFHVSEEDLRSFVVAQMNLDAYLTELDKVQNGVKGTSKADVSAEINYEKTYHRYSDFYSLANEYSGVSYSVTYKKATMAADGTITFADETLNGNLMDDFSTLYIPWRNAKIYEQYFYTMYYRYLMYSTMKEYNGTYIPNLNEIYTCIVIGVAEHFGDDDINKNNNSPSAMPTLQRYIENEGNTFIFHQTINASGNTQNMTNNLRTLFGQNYSHAHTETTTIRETKFDYAIGNDRYNLLSESNANYTGVDGEYDITKGFDVTITYNWGNIDTVNVVPNNTPGVIKYTWSNYGNGALVNFDNVPTTKILLKKDWSTLATLSPGTTASNGTINISFTPATANEYEGTITVTDGNPDKYHYTALLKNGGTIPLSPMHTTYYEASGVLTQNGHDNRLTYTQTGYMQSDVNVQADHVDFDYANMEKQGKMFTNQATQTNKGVITLYPFLIGSRLRISGTHANSFSTDIEDDDMVVYYALAGGDTGTQSSLAAADPQDGIDNYFLYSYGSVTYCGAGHSLLTGKGKDNNDERRLFINVILNTGKKSIFGPSIDVFDPYPAKNADGSLKLDEDNQPIYTNDIVKRADDGSYEMVVPKTDSIPEFTYRVTVPDANDDVASVKIYYDLSQNDGAGDDYGFVSGSDVLIFEANAKNDNSILKNKYKLIDSSIKALALKPEYFRPYDNKYTYIVIAVKTRKGIVTTQRIMVKSAPKLWDLT